MHVTGILAEKGFHAFDAEPKAQTGLKVPGDLGYRRRRYGSFYALP